jgi:hypothetical protein
VPGQSIQFRNNLIAGVEIPNRRLPCGNLVIPDHHSNARIQLIRPLHAFTHVTAVSDVDGKSLVAKLIGKPERDFDRLIADRDHRDRSRARWVGVHEEGQPLNARSPSDARKRWTTQRLNEAVVPTAGHDGALRAERVSDELERGVAVVVKPANERRVNDK